MIHFLKTHPEEFKATMSGLKTFELRKNDRRYRARDILCLQLFDPNKGYGNVHGFVSVEYVMNGGKFGLDPEYVAMSVRLLPNTSELELDQISPHNSVLKSGALLAASD